MFIRDEAKALLADLDIDPEQVTEDPTGLVLAVVANEFARHQTAAAEARAELAAALLDDTALVAPISSMSVVRRHDEAYHAMAALNPALSAAAAAWRKARV